MRNVNWGLAAAGLVALLAVGTSTAALAGTNGPPNRNGRETLFSIVPYLAKTVQRSPNEIPIPLRAPPLPPRPRAPTGGSGSGGGGGDGGGDGTGAGPLCTLDDLEC